MRYLGETEVTHVGEIRQGADGQLYQWVEGIDGFGNPAGWWKKLLRRALPIVRQIAPFVPGGAWETATVSLGPIILRWGAFLGELINFIIIAFVVFLIAKKILKEEKVAKK
jgi:hypothetical protein